MNEDQEIRLDLAGETRDQLFARLLAQRGTIKYQRKQIEHHCALGGRAVLDRLRAENVELEKRAEVQADTLCCQRVKIGTLEKGRHEFERKVLDKGCAEVEAAKTVDATLQAEKFSAIGERDTLSRRNDRLRRRIASLKEQRDDGLQQLIDEKFAAIRESDELKQKLTLSADLESRERRAKQDAQASAEWAIWDRDTARADAQAKLDKARGLTTAAQKRCASLLESHSTMRKLAATRRHERDAVEAENAALQGALTKQSDTAQSRFFDREALRNQLRALGVSPKA